MVKKKTIKTGAGTASLVLGIVSLCLLALFPVALIVGIIGLTMASKQNKLQPTKEATTGRILNIISVSISGVIFVLYIFIVILATALLI